MNRDIWFIFGLVLIVVLFEFAPKVGAVFVGLIVVYIVVGSKQLGKIFTD